VTNDRVMMTSSKDDDVEVHVMGSRRSTDASTPTHSTSPLNEAYDPSKPTRHEMMSPMDDDEDDVEDIDAWTLTSAAAVDQLRPLMRHHRRRPRTSSRSSWSSRSRMNYRSHDWGQLAINVKLSRLEHW